MHERRLANPTSWRRMTLNSPGTCIMSDLVGSPLNSLDTPQLLIDLDAVDANLRRMFAAGREPERRGAQRRKRTAKPLRQPDLRQTMGRGRHGAALG